MTELVQTQTIRITNTVRLMADMFHMTRGLNLEGGLHLTGDVEFGQANKSVEANPQENS